MALITWNDKLSVGRNEMDEQHKKLINIINRLNDAMLAQKGKEVLGGIFDELITYTVKHFAEEEAMMHQIKHPYLAAHMALHKDLCNTAVSLQKDFASGKAMVSLKTMEFLKKWLNDHILGEDMKYNPNKKD